MPDITIRTHTPCLIQAPRTLTPVWREAMKSLNIFGGYEEYYRTNLAGRVLHAQGRSIGDHGSLYAPDGGTINISDEFVPLVKDSIILCGRTPHTDLSEYLYRNDKCLAIHPLALDYVRRLTDLRLVDRFTCVYVDDRPSFGGYTDESHTNEDVYLMATLGATRGSNCTLSSVLPRGYLVPYSEALRAERVAAFDGPLSPDEARRLAKMRPILERVHANFYQHHATFHQVERKYVCMLRGYVSGNVVIRTDRFMDRIAATRNAMRAERNSVISNDGRSRVQMLDDTLKNNPPGAWPRSYDNPGQMVGIEMEFVVPANYRRPDIFGVHIGYDGSVRGHAEGYFGGGDGRQSDSEARCCVKYGDWRRLYAACDRLKSAGAVANKTCGVHVHLDMRGRPFREVRGIARRLAAALPFLNTLVPRNRWDSDHARHYCKQGCSFRNRYHAINGMAHRRFQTIEVRLFGGSLNAAKIQHWVEILRYIADKKGRFIRQPEDFMSDKKAPQHLKVWAERRRLRLYPVTFTADEQIEISEAA